MKYKRLYGKDEFELIPYVKNYLENNDGIEILAQYVDRSSVSVVAPSVFNFWILLRCLVFGKFQRVHINLQNCIQS